MKRKRTISKERAQALAAALTPPQRRTVTLMSANDGRWGFGGPGMGVVHRNLKAKQIVRRVGRSGYVQELTAAGWDVAAAIAEDRRSDAPQPSR